MKGSLPKTLRRPRRLCLGSAPRPSLPGRFVLIAILLLSRSLLCSPSRTASSSLPTLTRVDQIRRLSPDEADWRYPTRIRGVITYYNPAFDDLFVHDATGSIYVDLAEQTNLPYHVGDVVDVEGVTWSGVYAPEIQHANIRVVGTAELPRAKPVTRERLMSGAEDSQWIEVEGIVHSALPDSRGLKLRVDIQGKLINAFLSSHSPQDLISLPDSQIRMRGACASEFNSMGQFLGVHIFIPSDAQITIIEPAPTEPFSIPRTEIGRILRFSPDEANQHRLRIQGTVTLRHDTLLFVSGEAGSIQARLSQPFDLLAGDIVEVLGFPAPGEYTPILEDSVARKIGHGHPPAPIVLAAKQALQGGHDAQLVAIDS